MFFVQEVLHEVQLEHLEIMHSSIRMKWRVSTGVRMLCYQRSNLSSLSRFLALLLVDYQRKNKILLKNLDLAACTLRAESALAERVFVAFCLGCSRFTTNSDA